MIELKVADYCHNCRRFEPVSHASVMTTDDMKVCACSTIVECKHALCCKNIENYIRKGLDIDD